MANPVGRPTDYRPEFCEMAKELFKRGWSKFEVAAHFDVERSTLDNWMENHEDFFRAVNKGIELSECWWSGEGRENLGNKNFNARLYEIQMMNRFKWHRKVESDQKVTANIRVEDRLKDLE